MRFNLGDTLEDIVTGYKGIATARCEYLTGCTHYGLQGKASPDGKIPDPEYFDESRLTLVCAGLAGYLTPKTSGHEKSPKARW